MEVNEAIQMHPLASFGPLSAALMTDMWVK